MRIVRKFTLGYLLVSLAVGVVGYFSFIQLNKIAEPLKKDIPASIKALEAKSSLDSLSQLIRYYDEILTQSARNYAYTEEKKWAERYLSVEPKLKKIIKDAILKGDEKDKKFFSSINQANIALVEMEYKSMGFVKNGQREKAVKILDSTAYEDKKLVYEQGLRNYVHRRGAKYDEVLLSSTKTIDFATKGAQKLIRISSLLVLILTIVVFLFAIYIGIHISRSISNPIIELKNAVAEVGKGKLETKIDINTKDEIGQLAKSFRKMAENLRSTTVSKDYVDSIINNMVESLIVVAADGNIKTVNKSTLDLLGYTNNEIVNLHIDVIFAKESLLKETNFNNLIKSNSGNILEKIYLSKGGKEIPVLFSSSAMYDNNSNLYGVICVANDITEFKKTEEKLRFANFALDNNADATYWINSDGRIIYANKAAYQTLGYSYNELMSIRVPEIDPGFPEDVWQNHWKEMKEESTLIFESNHKTKDGKLFPVEIQATFHEYDGHEYICAFVRNIADRKRMEEEMLKIQKLESVGVLAGGIAHDFNNILTVILGTSGLAKLYMESGKDDGVFKALSTIENASHRAKDLTAQLLTFSKGGMPIKRETSIASLIKESADFVLRGSNVKCELLIPDNIWSAEIDEGQISQVINNLVINANQAMPDGGNVYISVENISKHKVEEIDFLSPGRYIKISIKDQGVGIPEKILQRIFDPYFTTKEMGSGLGLSSSYAIVNKHGGLIKVESEVNVGTTFFVYLPASLRESFATDKSDVIVPLADNCKILVMDDEECIRNAFKQMLSFIGYSVESAKDGEEALKFYREAIDMNKPFDAVIMDLTIPGGMGGNKTIKPLLEIDSKAKAIVYSGYSNDKIMSNYKEYGFKGVITKPFKIQEMNELLQKVIKGDFV